MNEKEKQQLKQDIIPLLQKKLGSDFQITLETVHKTNLSLDAIIIRNPNDTANLIPNIYLDFYYECKNYDINLIAEHIISTFRVRTRYLRFDTDNFLTFDKVKDNICCKLINYSKNKELLKKIPHTQFLDLAIVFYVLLNIDSQSTATALIHNSHIRCWNVTEQFLSQIAFENNKRLNEGVIQSIDEAIYDMLEEELRNSIEVNDNSLFEIENQILSGSNIDMYILSNKSKKDGAILMTDIDLLHSFAVNKQISHLIILPSSTHEVLLVPANGILDFSSLNTMVQEVNQTVVGEDEFLSDHCYLFEQVTRTISML